MNKMLLLTVIAAVFAAGCASTGATQATPANQTMTLEEALSKSAETRQKLIDAKQSYENAKTAAEVASGQKTAAQAAKETLQKKSDNAKRKLQSEKEAWMELMN